MTGSRVATRHSNKGDIQLNNASPDLLLPAPEKLLDANDSTDQSAVAQDHCPVKDAHRLSLKDSVENRNISKQRLKNSHDGHASPQPAIGEKTQLPGRPGKRTAIEQIEHLAEDKRIDCNGPGQVFVM